MLEKINPIVYDSLTTDFENYGLAVLENSFDLRIFKRLNSEYICSFRMPYTDEKVQYIEEENYIKVNGQLFIIRVAEKQMTERGEFLMFVEAEHVYYELLNTFIESATFTDASASTALTSLLDGTRFTGSAVSVSGTKTFDVQKKNPIYGINEIMTRYDCELKRDNFDVDLLPEVGSNNGVSFRYRKNMRGISRRVDSKNVITRLYVYGKDELTIESVNGGIKYLDSANINLYPVPKEHFITFSEISDPTELKAAGEDFLITVDEPLVSYECSVLELKRAIGWEDDFETFDEGDTVGIYNEDLNIAVSARIIEYEEWPNSPERSAVKLANFQKDMEDLNVKLIESRNIVQQITYKEKVNTFFLDGVINALVNQIRASGNYTNATVLENQGFLFENTDEASSDYGALYIGPGWLMLANSKIGDEWNWRTFGTGSGFTADEINAGILNAALVQILGVRDDGFFRIIIDGTDGIKMQKDNAGVWEDVFTADASGNLNLAAYITALGGTIGGWTIGADKLFGAGDIEGGVITGSTIQNQAAAGNRVWMDITGLHGNDAAGVERITLSTTPAKGAKAFIFRNSSGLEQGVITFDTENVDGAFRTGQYMTSGSSYILIEPSGDIRIQRDFAQGIRVTGTNRPEINTGGGGWLTIATQSELAHDHGNTYIKAGGGQNLKAQVWNGYLEVFQNDIFVGKTQLL